jgi:riboflavin kinase/FMN adenylyltransferase
MATHRLDWHTPPPEPCRAGIVTIGNFDGVHRGHAHLLARARAMAAPRQAPIVAVTFEPHPLQLLRPELYQPALTTLEDRAELLHAAGADHVVILHTERSLLELSAVDFFSRVIRSQLNAAGLVEGPNFGFGRNREGDVETLTHLCADAGLMLEIVAPLQIEGVPVSSSRVRTALVAGDVGAAERGLGRPYRLRGLVGVGERRGQGLGFPTANLTEVKTIIPGDGVYAVKAWPTRSHGYPAAANIGPNPTFGEQARKIEVHLIGFQGDLYGQPLTIDFVARLRDTRRFESVDDLLRQIESDVSRVQELLGRDAH